MLLKYFFIAIIILLANCVHPQNNAPVEIVEIPVVQKVEFNRMALIDFAKSYLGTDYCFGGIDPEKGFDCSGFVYFVFKHFDINVPRSSRDFKTYGTALKPEEFKLGDIVVFYGYLDRNEIGHVGIICEANGMQSKFIHSSSGKENSVIISQLDSKLYTKRFYKCVDVIEK